MIRRAWLKIRCFRRDVIGQSDALHSAAQFINKLFFKKKNLIRNGVT